MAPKAWAAHPLSGDCTYRGDPSVRHECGCKASLCTSPARPSVEPHSAGSLPAARCRHRQIITGMRQQVGTPNQTSGAHSPWIPVSAMARSGIQKSPQIAPAKRQASRASKSVFLDRFITLLPHHYTPHHTARRSDFLTTGKFLVNWSVNQ